MKLTKKIAILLFLGLVGIQFIPTPLNQSNLTPLTDFIKMYNPPADIANQLKNSCYDCHSNNTRYPWYNRIQPAKWFMAGHIKEGREELDLSFFGEYSTRKKKSKLKSIISQIEDDEMPLSSYTLIHRDAKIKGQAKEDILLWLKKIKSGL